MNEVKRSFLSAGVVVLLCGGLLAGNAYRGSQETGRNEAVIDTLVASAKNDDQVPEGAYYSQLTDLLKSMYVDEITDEHKLLDGSVRGMVLSLDDPHCLFLDKDQLAAYVDAREGKFQGVGVYFVLQYPPKPPSSKDAATTLRLPKLIAAEVVPGGPADKAGVKVGDWVYSVDGHWILNSEDLDKFRQVQAEVDAKKRPATDLLELRKDLRAKSESGLMPSKAMDKLFLGTEGTVKVTWRRGADKIETTLARDRSQEKLFEGRSSIPFRFTSSSASKLSQLISGKTELSLDLRNNAVGDYSAMIDCLELVAPKGEIGKLVSDHAKEGSPVVLKRGASSQISLHLLVDSSTRGAAEIFAKALSAKGLATVEGTPAGDPTAIELTQLPDGVGYTLAKGQFISAKEVRS